MTDASISADLEIIPAGVGFELAVVGSARLELGGLRLAVEDLRARLVLTFQSGERFGLFVHPPDHPPEPGEPPVQNLRPALSGPRGAMADLQLPGFGGGGYLEHFVEKDNHVWRGAVTARVGPVSVNGFVILGDGPGGFSLLVLLTAEFFPPIQLSFGFTLVGVGGMVGINRRPDGDALLAATRSGDLSGLLFPHDAAADAPRLVPVLDRCFPASAGDFIAGPMLKLGWGTPTLVSATVAVLVSSTGIVVIGRVAITLPCEQAALIRIEAIVNGSITPSEIYLGASLVNSHIVGIPVEGDVAFLVRSGPGATFAFSAGGFHPSFTPPESMRGMKRIGTEVSPGPVLHARLGAYLAVTSNTVQFGAEAELSAGFSGFRIRGGFRFDAIIVLDPFAFQADFTAHLGIHVLGHSIAGVSMRGHFSGPAPYCITGHAEISVLVDDIDVDLPRLSWGPSSAAPLPPARDPLAVLVAEIANPANWAPDNAASTLLTRLYPTATVGGEIAVHPMGQLIFRQNSVPLDIPLQRMDALPLVTPTTVTIETPDAVTDPRMVDFVPSQYFSYDEKTALASSGYVQCHGGFVYRHPAGATAGLEHRKPTPETYALGEERIVTKLMIADLPGVATYASRFDIEIPEVKPVVQLRDPGVANIASRRDLADHTADVTAAAGLSALPDNVAVTAGLLDRLGALSVGLQTVGAWELS